MAEKLGASLRLVPNASSAGRYTTVTMSAKNFEDIRREFQALSEAVGRVIGKSGEDLTMDDVTAVRSRDRGKVS